MPMNKKNLKRLFYALYGVVLLEAVFLNLYPNFDYLMTDIKLHDVFGGNIGEENYCIFANITTEICYNDTEITINSPQSNLSFKRHLEIGWLNESD